jgi:hypothetical protein
MNDSAGYSGLANSPLVHPTYHDAIMARVEERDFLGDITNSEITERIKDCGQMVQILRQPTVTPWRSYSLNQPMITGNVSITAVCLSICNAAYQCFKFDELTINAACDNWGLFEQAFLAANYEAFVSFQRGWVFGHMVAAVHPRNRGHKAGLTGAIDLGDRGNAKIVTRSTVAVELALLKQVLVETLHFIPGSMWLVVPPELQTVLVSSNFSNMSWLGTGTSMIVDGLWEKPLMGFNVYETIHLPWSVESGKVCYHILAGHKDAFTYAANIIRSRLVSGIDSFSVMYQMLAVWGGAALYPEYMALGYWCFDPLAA